MDEGYRLLADAVIIRAAKDYKRAIRVLKKNYNPMSDKYISAQKSARECERFFLSEWFGMLTNLDGATILRKLQEDV